MQTQLSLLGSPRTVEWPLYRTSLGFSLPVSALNRRVAAGPESLVFAASAGVAMLPAGSVDGSAEVAGAPAGSVDGSAEVAGAPAGSLDGSAEVAGAPAGSLDGSAEAAGVPAGSLDGSAEAAGVPAAPRCDALFALRFLLLSLFRLRACPQLLFVGRIVDVDDPLDINGHFVGSDVLGVGLPDDLPDDRLPTALRRGGHAGGGLCARAGSLAGCRQWRKRPEIDRRGGAAHGCEPGGLRSACWSWHIQPTGWAICADP